MLEAIDLQCTRGERLLFSGLSFRVERGACLHVAGANGAGKTSLLRILCGLAPPDAGEVRWDGAGTRASRDELRAQLIYVGHANGVKDDLSAIENLSFDAAIAGRACDEQMARAALAGLDLAGFEEHPARALSQGQRRRIALARLFLAADSPLWILDEPFTALDARGVDELVQLIDVHRRRNGVVVLTTHQDVALAGEVQRLELTAN